MAINTTMSGADIDRTIKAFLNAMNADNNDKAIYIKNGEISFEDGSILFNVLTPQLPE